MIWRMVLLILQYVHSVSFIEDEVGDAAQVGGTKLQVVDQATRGGDHDLHAISIDIVAFTPYRVYIYMLIQNTIILYYNKKK